jgi:hypothetical protein
MAYSRPMTSPFGTHDKPSAGDALPPKCSVIEVHVGELKQLFNAIDPSPFRDKDLDPKAEEFIVGWAKELPRDATLALVVDLDPGGRVTQRGYCATRRDSRVLQSTRSSIQAASTRIVPCGPDQPCHRTRCFSVGDCVGRFSSCFDEGQPDWRNRSRKLYDRRLGFHVARPLEIFLYDWWPIRSEARLSGRLAAMPVRIRYANATGPDAWREDWPAVSPRGERASSGAQPRALDQAS